MSFRATVYRHYRTVYSLVFGLALCMVAAAVVAVIQFATFFRGRRVCLNYVNPAFARLVLKFMGIRRQVYGIENIPTDACVYITNHPSALDVFLISSLGLPNTRSFLSKNTRKYLPLTFVGYACGTFYTSPQTEPARRQKEFQKADDALKKSGDSVVLTPEGERCPERLGAFNKGAFHLATSLERPIIPIYVDMPKAMSPQRTLRALPGRINIHINPPIDTTGWSLTDVEANKEATRSLYLNFPNGWHTAGAQSDAA